MNKPTATQLLIEDRLGEPLPAYVDKARSEGATWMRIAFDLGTRTGIVVTPETLRGWFPKEGARA